MLHSIIHIYCAFALFHSHGHKVTKMLRKGRLLWSDRNSSQFPFSPLLMKNLLFFHGYSISRFSLSICLTFYGNFWWSDYTELYFSSSGILFAVYPLSVSYFSELISSVFTLSEIISLGSLQWILPQGFGTSCSFCLECISPRLYTAHSLTLFRSLLKCNFLSKNFELPKILTPAFSLSYFMFFIALTMISCTIYFVYLFAVHFPH